MSELIKEQYHEAVRSLLNRYPDEWLKFEQLWASKELRKACLLVDNFIRENATIPTQEFRKADEDFYWDFIN